MKRENYIMLGCYIAFLGLLIVSNRFSYDMGTNNGKIILCDSQGGYLIEDYNGESCVNKSRYALLEQVKDEDLFSLNSLNTNKGELTQ